MTNHKFTATDLFLDVFLLLQVLMMLIGCAGASHNTISKINALPLPSYKPGTTFVYSDGSWEKITDITPHQVTWRDHRGDVYSGSPDFTYRPKNRQSQSRQVSRRFVPRSDFIVRGATSLWPLKTGNTASFTEMVTSRKYGEPEKYYQRKWTCQVIGPQRVVVVAGEFNTWKIACERYNNYQNPSKAKVREIQTWNYAPEIGHYVFTERQYTSGKSTRRLELLAVLPPADEFPTAVQSKMSQAFQEAMEFNKSGDSAAWSFPDASWSGKVTPTGTFKLSDGRFSRRYVQTVKSELLAGTYYGMAVRNSQGIWEIPRRK